MNGNDQASDYDVLCAVSDSLSRVPVARPPQLAAVVARGRARQRRRRASGLAAVAAAAAAVTVTVTALPAGGHPAGPGGGSAANPAVGARLAAWTVTRQASGDIKVTVNELSDPAGLQSTLRADGVPASVTFLGQPTPACRLLGSGPGLLGKIFPEPSSGVVRHLGGGLTLGTGGKAGGDLVINPSAIPSGAGLQLGFSRTDGSAPGHFRILSHMALVHASPQCTGSPS